MLSFRNLRKSGIAAPKMIKPPKAMKPRWNKPWLPSRPMIFGTIPPPTRKAMGMVKEMTIFCIFLEPIRDKAAKAGGKKQTPSIDWQKTAICINRPDNRPSNKTEMPLKKRTIDNVSLRPKRSDSHPIKNGIGNVSILDMVIKELAWDWSMPWLLTRNNGSIE